MCPIHGNASGCGWPANDDYDYDSDGYEPDDPKSVGYRDRLFAAADDR